MYTTGIVSPYYRSTLCKCVAVTVKVVNVIYIALVFATIHNTAITSKKIIEARIRCYVCIFLKLTNAILIIILNDSVWLFPNGSKPFQTSRYEKVYIYIYTG